MACLLKLLIPSAVSINGMARPREYAKNSWNPAHLLCEFIATARIAVRIGPIQGVQPAAKPMPIRYEPISPTGLSLNT